MLQSPYVQHRHILLDEFYGTAYLLQDFVLHQHDADQFPFDIDQHWGGFDTRHRQIYSELKEWVWNHGLDSTFREIAGVIIARRQKAAEENFDELTRLRNMAPGDYRSDDGEATIDGHKSALRNREMWQARYAQQGFPVGLGPR